jgi:hypothetical protein
MVIFSDKKIGLPGHISYPPLFLGGGVYFLLHRNIELELETRKFMQIITPIITDIMLYVVYTF